MRWNALVGKKFPNRSGTLAFALATGVEQEVGTGYDGALRARAPRGWAFLLRPNVEW